MKQLRIEPLGTELDVRTATRVASALVKQTNGKVKLVCGGKGLCATCHVKVLEGANALSTLTERERMTLARITGADINSRLGCQAKIIYDGATVEVPAGIYLESLADLEALIGRRTDAPFYHPVTGGVLVPAGKIITRSVVMSLQGIEFDIVEKIQQSDLTN
jgi:ferredoxin